MAWGSRAGGQPGLSKLLWAPPENSTKLLCSFLAKMDPFFLICWCPPVRNIWFDLIVVSVPLPLSIPRPSSFLSLAKFSQTSSEPTHHTELGISCKLMFCRCSSCLTCWLSCPLLLRTVEKKKEQQDFYLSDVFAASSHPAVHVFLHASVDMFFS